MFVGPISVDVVNVVGGLCLLDHAACWHEKRHSSRAAGHVCDAPSSDVEGR